LKSTTQTITIDQINNNSQNKVSKSLAPGIITGQIAGLIMAVVVMLVFALFLGKNLLYPVQVIGSALLGESALQGFNILAILLGLILHQLGPSLLWGFIFAKIINGTTSNFNLPSTSKSLLVGLIIGVISMLGPYVLIPTLTKTLHGVDIWNREVPLFWDWAAHLVFGVSFALYPKIAIKLKANK